ncbi:MAG: V-type ATP synthase subunit F [Candidatus Margulisiibacteriota bacterium]|nr:hypothetical protein [Candidatus Margulisiibacteriota bacterium]
MSKIALLGPKDMVNNLSLLGIKTFPCENEHEAERTLEEIKNAGKYGIIMMVDFLAHPIIDQINELNQKTQLNILLLSGNRPGMELAQERSRALIRYALGSAPANG